MVKGVRFHRCFREWVVERPGNMRSANESRTTPIPSSSTTPGADSKSMTVRTFSRCSEEKSIQPTEDMFVLGIGNAFLQRRDADLEVIEAFDGGGEEHEGSSRAGVQAGRARSAGHPGCCQGHVRNRAKSTGSAIKAWEKSK